MKTFFPHAECLRSFGRFSVEIICIMFLLPIISFGQKWCIQPIPIETRWTRKVNPSHVLEEYPRPQMQRNEWQNLNGLWLYTITDKSAINPGPFIHKILVPFPIESALSGVQQTLKPDQILWYKRYFSYKGSSSNSRLLLNFGAVDQKAEVFVNGKPVGNHEGGYQSYSLDITNVVKRGNNELIVKVVDPTDVGYMPKGKQTLNPSGMYYTSTSGIWQTVWLETVPNVAISSLKLTPDIDKGTIALTVMSNIASPKDYTIRAQIKSPMLTPSLQGELAEVMELPVPHAHLWSPNDPYLYDLQVSLIHNGEVIDSVSSYFGMRKIEVKKDDEDVDRIFLNNQPYFNLGVLDQGFWPDGIYTAPTDEALSFDIKAIKAMGFNTIRKHIKVEPDRWYYHCDKLGMLVWQDMVNPPNDSKEAQREFEKETAENIRMLYNHPCITTWVVFNEGWGAYAQGRITEWVKGLDPSRLVNGHTGENYYRNSPKDNSLKWQSSDMTDIHSYPRPEMPPSLTGKAKVLGEFGGIGAMAIGHQWDDLSGWGYIKVSLDSLAKVYEQMSMQINQMGKKGLSGSIYTQPFDVESEQNGLISYDRSIIKIPLKKIAGWNVLNSKSFELMLPEVSINLADTVNPKSQYSKLLTIKGKFKDDSIFNRRIAIMALNNKDTVNARLFASNYYHVIKNNYKKENLRFLKRFMFKSDDPQFDFFLRNVNKIDGLMGNGFAREAIMNIIYRENFEAEINKSDTEPDWSMIENKMFKKFGDIGVEKVMGIKMLYYKNRADTKKFESSYFDYFSKYGEHFQSIGYLNDLAWRIFEVSDNSQILIEATKWARKAINAEQNNPYYLDTYANLLYKTGNITEAIKVEETAVINAPENDIIMKNLIKMKEAKKTWD